jgi:hypothetical protein
VRRVLTNPQRQRVSTLKLNRASHSNARLVRHNCRPHQTGREPTRGIGPDTEPHDSNDFFYIRSTFFPKSAQLGQSGYVRTALQCLQRHRRTLNIESTAGVCYVVHMAILPPDEIPMRNRRRSKRVQHKTSVMARFQDANMQSISEKTHTIVVSDHGALILLAAAVRPQQIIRLEHLGLGEELLCRVASLGPTLMGKTQVAVEFIIPKPGFWGPLPNSKTPELSRSLKK